METHYSDECKFTSYSCKQQTEAFCLHPDTKANNGCWGDMRADKPEDNVDNLSSEVKPNWLNMEYRKDILQKAQISHITFLITTQLYK